MEDVRLMKGNEAIAHAAIRSGADGYFGYPITPQSEVMETLMAEKPWETTGMVVLQAESEVSSINMVYGAAGSGKRVMTSSSSPGMSLMQEGVSYIAGAELPCLLVNVMRGGPGLGTIQPSQADYFQTVKGGGHGDYRLITLAPSSVQEMADFVALGFDLAFKYRTPAMVLSDGMIGQLMEKVVLPPFRPRKTDEEIGCEDADYLLVAFGSSARICQKAMEVARGEGLKLGLLRPITLWPFPTKAISDRADKVKGILSVELNAGQMVEDVRLAVNGRVKVEHFGRLGGIVFTPDEIIAAVKEKLM